MTVTIEQRLAAFGLDDLQAQVVSERYAIILRDPEDDATSVPNDGTIYLRIVDLAGDPADPTSITVNVYVDQGSGEVQAYDNSAILAPWNGSRSAYAESDGSSPYCFKELTLDQGPAVFASEQQVTVHLELTIGFGGWGHFDWGHEDWGHAPTSSESADVYYDFTAADSIAPNLTSAVAIDPWTVRVTFDPRRVTYKELLEWFFRFHDPTQKNRQGPDVGTQYRSAIFAANDAQLDLAKRYIGALQRIDRFRGRRVVTEVRRAGPFHEAEAYHQNYHAKHGGSCPIPFNATSAPF